MALDPYSADSFHPIIEGLAIGTRRAINRTPRPTREPTRGVNVNPDMGVADVGADAPRLHRHQAQERKTTG
jgi:hypothetical protein